jgi:hypothetical protein
VVRAGVSGSGEITVAGMLQASGGSQAGLVASSGRWVFMFSGVRCDP